MKVFSLLSTASALTILAVSGFCKEQSDENFESRLNQLEQTMQEQSERFISWQEGVLADRDNSGYQSDNQMDHESRLNRLEKNCPGQRSSGSIAVNSVHGCLERGFTLAAEFIWWRAQIDNIEYAARASHPISLGVGSSLSASFKEPDFKYDPGVRLSFGYDFGRSQWDLLMTWTFHHTHPCGRSGSSESGSSLYALNFQTGQGGNFANTNIANTAAGKWRVQLNVFDLEAGYDYFYSSCFSIRPRFGLKAALINMHLRACYTGLIDGVGSIPDANTQSDSYYWGIGPSAGIDSYLHLGCGFSIYTKLAGAMIYGQYDSKVKELYQRFDKSPTELTFSHNNYSRLRSMASIALGLEWAKCYSDSFLMSFHIAWENQYWWKQLELLFTTPFQPDGDLTYSGFDIGARFDF